MSPTLASNLGLNAKSTKSVLLFRLLTIVLTMIVSQSSAATTGSPIHI